MSHAYSPCRSYDPPYRQAAGSRFSMRRAGDALLAPLVETLETWIRRARERRELLRLSERDLKDIGLNRYEAAVEAGKPFWR